MHVQHDSKAVATRNNPQMGNSSQDLRMALPLTSCFLILQGRGEGSRTSWSCGAAVYDMLLGKGGAGGR